MTLLTKRLISQVEKSGALSIAEYMTICLLDPKHGYYTRQQPFGSSGDFVTAPEVSQMFGELLGLALAQSWLDQGAPAPFILAELGPGRGTLMSDVLRATKSVSGFQEAADIWLVEASPALQDTQRAHLAEHHPNLHWADSLDAVPDGPLFLIANEFFDCMPIRQYRRTELGWQEQMITAKDGALGFMLGRPLPDQAVPDRARKLAPGSMIETSAASAAVAEDIARRIGRSAGAAIIVDYGDWDSSSDTLQAVKAHKKVGALDHPGRSDLTAHVSFSELANAALPFAAVSELTDQASLLAALGIVHRAQALAVEMDQSQEEKHVAAFQRLTDADQMGQLFKAISIFPQHGMPPPGFTHDTRDPDL